MALKTALTYHYCSLETACATPGTQSLRLNDIMKPCDSTEIKYGYATALHSLKCVVLQECERQTPIAAT